MIGQRLGGKYDIQSEIGRGGMGIVYRAYDVMLQRPVAVKVLAPQLAIDPQFLQRFEQEAVTAANLRHPHIVTIHDVGAQPMGDRFGQSIHYIVMEYLDGVTLDQWLHADSRKPSPAQAEHIVRQVADALQFAHDRGVIHRDVKPSNIMLDPAGRITLMDFGLVRAGEGTGLTRSGLVVGTPEYMAPEQAMGGAIDRRTDIYSFGVVIYKLLTGQVPFARTTPVATAHAHVYEAPPPLRQARPDLSKPLEAVVMKALAKDPAQRYQQAADLAAEFAAAVAGKTPANKRVAPTAATEKRAQTQPPPTPVTDPAIETRVVERGAAAARPPVVTAPVAAPAALERQRSSPTGLFLAVITGLVVIILLGMAWMLSQPRGGSGEPEATVVPTPVLSPVEPVVTDTPTNTPEVTSTLTPTPLRTGTHTPTPTITSAPTWTPGFTPTPTSFPTETPEPTAARTPASTPTRIPETVTPAKPAEATPTAASVGYQQAPMLVGPPEGADAVADQTFSWRWDGPALRADERFDWRLLRGRTGEDVVDVRQAREPSLVYPFTNLPGGDYYWSVRVVREGGDGVVVSVLSPESVRWPIRWKAPSPASPTDTSAPTEPAPTEPAEPAPTEQVVAAQAPAATPRPAVGSVAGSRPVGKALAALAPLSPTPRSIYLPLLIFAAPAAPVLAEIDNADGDGQFSVHWSAVGAATYYRLEEAQTADFVGAHLVYSNTVLMAQIDGRGAGRFYYRVQAGNVHSTSPWSNVQWVDVLLEMEPNNVFTQANGPLVSGLTYHGDFANAGDLDDYFVFDLAASHDIDVWLSAIPAGQNYDLIVRNSAGQVPGGYSGNPGNLDEHVHLSGMPADRYFIRVFNRSGATSEQRYDLRAIFFATTATNTPTPTPTATPTPTWTATPTPALVNGGFESGLVGWASGGNYAQPQVRTDVVRSGAHSVALGNPDETCSSSINPRRGDSWLSQIIRVPNTSAPRLELWYRIFTWDLNSQLSDDFDRFEIWLNNTRIHRDANRDGVYGCGRPATDLGWRRSTYDLSAYRGQQVTLKLSNVVWPDEAYNTWTYVDDIQVVP